LDEISSTIYFTEKATSYLYNVLLYVKGFVFNSCP